MLPTVIGLPYSPCSFGIGYWSILRCWLIVIYLVITTDPHCTIRFWKKKAEDIFSTLNSGKKITKLDLSQAYLQLPIDVQSQQLYFTTINTHKGCFNIHDYLMALLQHLLFSKLPWTRFCRA